MFVASCVQCALAKVVMPQRVLLPYWRQGLRERSGVCQSCLPSPCRPLICRSMPPRLVLSAALPVGLEW
jgi:hypothetical protein